MLKVKSEIVEPAQSRAPYQDAIDSVFAAQQKHALELRKSTYKDRIELLDRFEKAFVNSYEKIYTAAGQDYGKTEAEVDLTEILAVRSELSHLRKHLKKWMKARSVLPTLSAFGTSAKIMIEPRGVCLVISPWNYPYNLSFGPLLTALAAGNTVILKPSEMTPHMSAVIREILEQAYKPHEVAVIEGDANVSAYLTSLPFDHIFFTGSPSVGKHVMAAAARNLTSVTLELGGKSPTIVDESANLKKAAKNIMWGKFTNNGQTCIAPDYLFVHKAVKDDLIKELSANIQALYGSKEQIKTNPDYCRIVNQRHYKRVNKLLENAVEDGATVIDGGVTDASENFITPTILDHVSPDSDILEEEIFGPLLPVMSYTDLNQVIDYINAKPKPLALYIYSNNNKNIDKILTETSSGDAVINHNLIHFLHLNLPFGGVNNSGIGKSHAELGFKAFSHERSILRDRFSSTDMMYPPYTPKVKKLIKAAIKFLT